MKKVLLLASVFMLSPSILSASSGTLPEVCVKHDCVMVLDADPGFADTSVILAQNLLSEIAKEIACQAAGLSAICTMTDLLKPEVARGVRYVYFNKLAAKHCNFNIRDARQRMELSDVFGDVPNKEKCKAVIEAWEFIQKNRR